MASYDGKCGKHCGEGSPRMPKKTAKNVSGGDKIQKATNRVKKGKHNS